MDASETAVHEDWIGGGLAGSAFAQEADEAPGAARPVTGTVAASQAWFRSAMDAMARPGSAHEMAPPAGLPDHLPGPAAGLLLTLADSDTVVWLSPRLRASNWAATWIGFHAGAPVVDATEAASFAFVARGDELPAFDRFRQGEPRFPDRSATLLIEVDGLDADTAATRLPLEGPGILDQCELRVAGAPSDLAARCRENRARFPLGIDVFLVDAERFVALPRTVRIAS